MDLQSLFILFAVLLFSLSVHESAHAWAADRLGDPTARRLGRLTLNPLVHIDPVGTLLLPLVAFASGAPIIGWAKPVPVNVGRLRRFRADYVLVAAAGPASNILLAMVASIVAQSLAVWPASLGAATIDAPLRSAAVWAIQLNLLLAVFNMLPIPPLDGGNVLGGLLPARLAGGFDRLRPFGFLLLYGLMLSGTLGAMLRPPYRVLARLILP